MPFALAARIKLDLYETGRRAVTVDIDDTLSPSIVEIIRTMLALGFPNEEGLAADALYAKYRHGRLPGWTDEHYTQAMIENDCDGYAQAMPGALKAIRTMLEHKIDIACYLTARSEAIRNRTETFIRRLGFPERPIVMRPPKMTYEESHAWKAELLHALEPEILGHIDDHPHVATMRKAGFTGKFYVLGQEPTGCETVIGCPTWDDVWREIRKNHL